jgi:hypothetical protein
MAFEPLFEDWAGIRPLLKTARTIIERDMEAALIWAYGESEPGPVYARIQYTQRHSQAFPLLVLQAASSTPEPLSGGILQRHVLDCEIYLTRATQTGEDIDTLALDLIRYLDATVMCFLSAPAVDWTVSFRREPMPERSASGARTSSSGSCSRLRNGAGSICTRWHLSCRLT